jgi:uncharacterized membrane protein HdeD (DUF308 family)
MEGVAIIEIEQRKQIPRWVLMVGGILAAMLGGILLWAPAKTQANTWTLLVIILGLYWLATGILEIVSIFQNRKQWGWRVFTGIISILAGGYIIVYPAAAAIVLPQVIVLVLGIWGIVQGIIFLTMAFAGGGLGAGILGGLGLILGIVLVVNFTSPSVGRTLIWVSGALALAGGIFMIVQSLRSREPLYSGT